MLQKSLCLESNWLLKRPSFRTETHSFCGFWFPHPAVWLTEILTPSSYLQGESVPKRTLWSKYFSLDIEISTMYLCLMGYLMELSWTLRKAVLSYYIWHFFSFWADYNWVTQHVGTGNSHGGPLTTSCARETEAMQVFQTCWYLGEMWVCKALRALGSDVLPPCVWSSLGRAATSAR